MPASEPTRWTALGLAALSGLLMTLAFPPFEWRYTAWFALVPLWWISLRLPPKRALVAGWIGGMVHWVTCAWWVSRVNVFGMLLLAAYCALYWMVVPGLLSVYLRGVSLQDWKRNIGFMLAGAAVWTGCEFFRATLLTGFAWNTIAISQFRNVALIQVADIGGVYLVGFIIASMNLGFVLTACRYAQCRMQHRRIVHYELLVVILMLAGTLGYGIPRLNRPLPDGRALRVALVQTNVPQDIKWSDAQELMDRIYNVVEEQTILASGSGVELIVWPETAVPHIVSVIGVQRFIGRLVERGVPVFAGAMDARMVDGEERFYNSSILFRPDGQAGGVYDKRHLVLFGEYVPFGRWVEKVFSAMTPFEGNVSPGTEHTVFRLDPSTAFSSLICFEDTLPYLSRDAVRNGARLLINQTNDAWFDPSAAPVQHMAHCVFRSVENRVPSLRCTNTGRTCAINHWGGIHAELVDEQGGARFAGYLDTRTVLPGASFAETLYTRRGDWFAMACAVVSGVLIALAIFRTRRKIPA